MNKYTETLTEICRAFGIPAINVKRSVKVYRDKGIAGLFTAIKTKNKEQKTKIPILPVNSFM